MEESIALLSQTDTDLDGEAMEESIALLSQTDTDLDGEAMEESTVQHPPTGCLPLVPESGMALVAQKGLHCPALAAVTLPLLPTTTTLYPAQTLTDAALTAHHHHAVPCTDID
eukprot:TRINITY_DN20025_c0_g1_i5.p2 TRINITY_DN20025_c0_g1~~TRINITY_DN20025_c0_g1_i5.p2  ORF type:complete len:113 (+),score=35.31 TRINITY_DN20025_c0_g1_i5:62-400(+)